MSRAAYYFGCWHNLGHNFHDQAGQYITLKQSNKPIGMPDYWWENIDSKKSLLRNGRIPDQSTGKVYWTCGGITEYWYAFYWWDNSVDDRPGSHSGFYVKGYPNQHAQEAFEYAKRMFPRIVERQLFPLVLQP